MHASSVFLFIVHIVFLLQHNTSSAQDDKLDIATDGGDSKVNSITGDFEQVGAPTTFTFSQCGDVKSLPIQIKKFTVKPDPVVMPGVVKVKLSFKVKETIAEPIKARVTIQGYSSTEGWVKIPCNEKGYYGSCNYENVCSILQKVGPFCPKEITEKGLTCTCPLEPGKYNFKTVKIPLMAGKFNGALRMVAKLESEDDRLLACMDTTIINHSEEPMDTTHNHEEL